MANDEGRMTNDKRMTKPEIPISGFETGDLSRRVPLVRIGSYNGRDQFPFLRQLIKGETPSSS